MTQAKTPKQSQYDWLKAVKERPEDAAEVLSYFSEVRASARPCNEAMSKLRASARPQTVEEAAVTLAKFACAEPNPDKDLEYDRVMGWGAALRLHREKLEKLVQDCKDAMAREAAEKETK